MTAAVSELEDGEEDDDDEEEAATVPADQRWTAVSVKFCQKRNENSKKKYVGGFNL